MEYSFIVFIIFLLIVDIYLAGSRKAPLFGFVFGIVSICVVAVTGSMTSTDLPFYPLPSVLLGLTAIVTLFSSGYSLRGSR